MLLPMLESRWAERPMHATDRSIVAHSSSPPDGVRLMMFARKKATFITAAGWGQVDGVCEEEDNGCHSWGSRVGVVVERHGWRGQRENRMP
jgi:hypothetical protein